MFAAPMIGHHFSISACDMRQGILQSADLAPESPAHINEPP